MRPPTVSFVSPCFHPNVHESKGDICLDILQDKWSCVYNVRSVLLSIQVARSFPPPCLVSLLAQSLLGDPNTASPLNAEAASLYDNDSEGYKKKVDAFYERGANK